MGDKLTDLDRRFVEWTKGDPGELARYLSDAGGLSWPQLKERKRVVILAEAGSGKSVEFKEQARKLRSDGAAAFYATVQDVADFGLRNALKTENRAAFDRWIISPEPAWFFIDSIDEAKLDGTHLRTAFRQVSGALSPALARVHLLFSSRYSDWETDHDRKLLSDELPIPPKSASQKLLDPNENLVALLEGEKSSDDELKPEQPIVVVMTQLDRQRVAEFAKDRDIENVDQLIAAIDASDLWQFARRPRDLQWLVDYWHSRGTFGTLSAMIGQSIAARSKEDDRTRGQKTKLTKERVREALQRVGAALVFGRTQTVHIPDSELSVHPDRDVVRLEDVLPNWSVADRDELLRLPIFDPATFGRVRLHNDNEGNVRAYLAAEWLWKARQGGCPPRTVLDLLFADIYGLELVKPSMAETAAWLALKDAEVAGEIVKRDPLVLLTHGDPGSLPSAIKEAALDRLVTDIVAEGEPRFGPLDNDALRRFASGGLSTAAIQKAWKRSQSSTTSQALLLRLIWLGKIQGCHDIAQEVAFNIGRQTGELLAAFSARAVFMTANDAVRRKHAAFVVQNSAALSETVVWDAVEEYFPSLIGIDELLQLTVSARKSGGSHPIEFKYEKIVERISAPPQLLRLLDGILKHVQVPFGYADREPSGQDSLLLHAAEAAAVRLLVLSPKDTAPDAVIDVAMLLGDESRRATSSGRNAVGELLRGSSGRRARAFWRAADKLTYGHPVRAPVKDVNRMSHSGWYPDLRAEDLDWLLEGAKTKTDPRLKKLATDGAMQVWHSTQRPAELLQRIEAALGDQVDLAKEIRSWTEARPSPEYESMLARREEIEAERASERQEINQSWIDYASRLRADPAILSNLLPTTAKSADSRLVHLHDLLRRADTGRSRYAIESLDALVPVVGEEVARAGERAFTKFWRDWKPNVRSGREKSKLASAYPFDAMGIAGIAMEARLDKSWAAHLNPAEAERAAQYATLEMNGFPEWLSDVARHHPEAVIQALMSEVEKELSADFEGRRSTLEDIANSSSEVVSLLAKPLFEKLRRTEPKSAALKPLLKTCIRGLSLEQSSEFVSACIERLERSQTNHEAISFLSAIMQVDPAAGAAPLIARGRSLGAQGAQFLRDAIRAIFGGWSSEAVSLPPIPVAVLEDLLTAAYGVIRPEDDNDHNHDGPYELDDRDDEEEARGRLLQRLYETPGRATFETLLRLAENPAFAKRSRWLVGLSSDRAAFDSEHAPWHAFDVLEFERDFDDTPRTSLDLQRFIRRRLETLEHDLNHGEFQQAETLRHLPNERAVQKWTADSLALRRRRAHTVERESHLAEENEPDIRVRAVASDATVPLEIKVAEDWSLTELEDALRDQLGKKYLRHRDHRHGVLILVHRRRRPRGWKTTDGSGYLTFEEVVAHLAKLAASISAGPGNTPQPVIATLNVVAPEAGRNEPSIVGARRNVRGRPKKALRAPAKKKKAKKATKKPVAPKRAAPANAGRKSRKRGGR